MIKVIGFSKIYSSHSKQTFAVEDINLNVENGFITGLVGPNGSGKSTIMKAICTFHYPTKGQILISDKNNNFFDICEFPQKSMELCGYVPEISCLPPNMTVIEFLVYAAKAHNLTKEQSKKSIEKLVIDFSLQEFLDKKIKTLSKGQQQRVSFAQALIHDPANLILDEPISGLDPAQIVNLRKYIKELSKNKSILISTHILSEVNALCSKAFIVHQGKIYNVENLSQIENEFIKITEVNK